MLIEDLLDKLDYRAAVYLGEDSEIVLTLPDRKFNQDYYNKCIWYWPEDDCVDIFLDDEDDTRTIQVEPYAMRIFIHNDIEKRLLDINYNSDFVRVASFDSKPVKTILELLPKCEDPDGEIKLLDVFEKLANGAAYESCERLANHYGVYEGFQQVLFSGVDEDE